MNQIVEYKKGLQTKTFHCRASFLFKKITFYLHKNIIKVFEKENFLFSTTIFVHHSADLLKVNKRIRHNKEVLLPGFQKKLLRLEQL